MISSLKKSKELEKRQAKVPTSTQDTIAFDAVSKDGVFVNGNRKYSASWVMDDINYSIASEADQRRYFLGYSEVLNSLDAGVATKITIANTTVGQSSREDFEIMYASDNLDPLRSEYNNMLSSVSEASSRVHQQKYITQTVERGSIEEARSYFDRQDISLNNKLGAFGSHAARQSGLQRLQTLTAFYRPDALEPCLHNFDEIWKKGHSFKDHVAPDGFKLHADYFEMDGRFGRVLYLKNYATYIRDSIIDELTEQPISLVLSIDILPTSSDEAIKIAEQKQMSVETNIHNWLEKQQRQKNFFATVPYRMQQQREEIKEYLDDLTERDQRMMFVCITLVHTAANKEELDLDTKTLMSIASSNRCDLGTLYWQQLEGLHTVLPFGHRKLDVLRTLTTESTAVFIPFRTQDVSHKNGIYYGYNAISKNILLVDRRQLINGNAWIVGASGSGKSFLAKREIACVALQGGADIIIIDPEREYGHLVRELNGEVIELSQKSRHRINALDVSLNYGEDGSNPLIAKGQFVLSLVEMITGHVTAQEKSIIDRCTRITYQSYKSSNYEGTSPTLNDFYRVLLQQKEPVSQNIALKLELFVKGSLDIFAQDTNVDVENSLICYDIHELGSQLYPVGLFVVLDSILNRISRNRASSRPTYIYIDEIYLLMAHKESSNFLKVLWKRIRKYAGFLIGITQNITSILDNADGVEMLGNSELQVYLNQDASDRARIVNHLSISDIQAKYISDVGAGQGLLKVGASFIPFRDEFPTDTQLYRLMTTKPGELRNNSN